MGGWHSLSQAGWGWQAEERSLMRSAGSRSGGGEGCRGERGAAFRRKDWSSLRSLTGEWVSEQGPTPAGRGAAGGFQRRESEHF